MTFGRKQSDSTVNLLDLRPIRNLDFEVDPENRVVLLVPKFRNKHLVKWVMPRIRKKFFRVKLDEYGSFVWNQCDGRQTVAEVSEKLKEQFGEEFDPTYGRIQRFVQMFLKDKFLVLPEHQTPAG